LQVLACVIAGCGSASGPPPRAAERLDARVLELGPLLLGESQVVAPPTGAARGRLPAYRVESFGGTVLDIDVWGPDAVVVVQGPLPGDDGDGSGGVETLTRAGASRWDASAHVTGLRLPLPGVYRVIVTGRRALDEGQAMTDPLTLVSRCTAGLLCERPVLSDRDLGKLVRSQPELEHYAVVGPPDWTNLGSVSGRFHFIMNLALMDQLPDQPQHIVSGAQLRVIAEWLNRLDVEPPAPVTAHGELLPLLGGCDAPRPRPAPVLGSYSVGNYPDLGLTRCQVAGSVRFANILNGIALLEDAAPGERAEVSYRGRVYHTAAELVGGLLDAGHQIELDEVRSNVQVTTLTVGGKDVFWPLWVNTGLSPGQMLPAGRSQLVWRISGPDLNARIGFIVSPHGARFVPLVDRPPAWVGHRVTAATTGPTDVTLSFYVASAYARSERSDLVLRRSQRAQVGTINDAVAVFLRAVWGDSSDAALPFPLLRPRQRANRPRLLRSANYRWLDRTVDELPHDADSAALADWASDPRVNRHGLTRAHGMVPFDPDSPVLELFPGRLRLALCELEKGSPSPACLAIRNATPVR
jgi:hypothetical protein